ncbi:MAG: Crp/Fnr family transcriptional regulator [Candidatus Firestonebacteria bacterium]
MNKKDFLKKVPVFSDISLKDLNLIGKRVLERKYPKGSYLFFENEEGNTLFVIVSGLIKIFTSDKSGRIKTLAYLKEGDFFGEMAMLDQDKRSASAVVVEDSDVMILNRSDFQHEILNRPLVALRVMKTLCARLRVADKQIEDLTFKNLPGRVASTLLDLSAKYGVKEPEGIKINLKLTHQELADMIGTAREVVTSILGKFKKSKCIAYKEKNIVILNETELKTWIN